MARQNPYSIIVVEIKPFTTVVTIDGHVNIEQDSGYVSFENTEIDKIILALQALKKDIER